MKRFILSILLTAIIATTCQAATQFDFLLSQVRTSVGALPGGKVYFYSPGTTTLKTIWLDPNEITPASNPYTLDTNGTALLYGTGGYRVVIKDSNLVTKYDRSIVYATGDGSSTAVDATSGNATYTLPSLGVVTVTKTDATANTVTINPSPGTDICGLTSYVLYLQYETVTMSLIGTTWVIK